MSFQGIDRGSLLVVISDQFVTRAEEGGVRQYAPSPGESVQCHGLSRRRLPRCASDVL